MKRLVATAMTLMISAAIGTAAASAHDFGYRYEDGAYGRGYYDYARVVNVDPIIEIVNQPVRSQRCYGGNNGYAYNGGYDNDGYGRGDGSGYDGYNDRGYGYGSSGYGGYSSGSRYYGHSGVNGGKLLGALVGGALGNTVGKGDGRKAATIGGAVLGYAIAGSVQRQNHYGSGYGYDGYHGGGYDNRYDNGNYGYGDSGYDNSTRCQIVTTYHRDRRVVGYDVTYDYQGRIQHVRSAVDPGDSIRVRVDVRPGV